MAKMTKRRLPYRWLFLTTIIVVTSAALVALVAVLLYTFNVTRSEIAVILLCIAVAIAAVGAVLSTLANRLILKPVVRLSEASEQIARGEFDLNLVYEGAIREYRDTYRSFNTMARELQNIETLRSDFIANVSHEFKTPLGVIEGYATLLRDPVLSEAEREEAVDRILQSSGRLSSLVSNILMLSKLENQTARPDSAPFLLDEQLRQVVLTLEPLWSAKDLELELDLPAVRYNGSESLLYHVWSNLLGNACKFSPQGGTVGLRLTESAREVTVTVTDQGPGMTAEEQRHVFDKFYQSDRSRRQEGSGLGLPLAKRVVQLCGGRIFLDTELGKGSIFTVTLPKI